MTAATAEHGQDGHGHDGHGHDGHGPGHAHAGPHFPVSHYKKIYVWLIVLFFISAIGPEVSRRIFGEGNLALAFTLFTAFGIAFVKAYLVASNFMHLNIEKKIATMIITVALAFMLIFFFAVAPDVMKHEGERWVNVAAKQETARRIEREGAHGEKMKGHGDHAEAGHAEAGHAEAAKPEAAKPEGAAPAH